MEKNIRYLNSVIAFLVYNRYVTPPYIPHDVHHCFYLIVIARYCTREIFEALFVGQFRAG